MRALPVRLPSLAPKYREVEIMVSRLSEDSAGRTAGLVTVKDSYTANVIAVRKFKTFDEALTYAEQVMWKFSLL